MTSSLVGSEMCIRDSAPRVPDVTEATQALAPPPPAIPPQAVDRNLVPVSYTHLTLPTICSV
eukprot:11362173-Prorocentrum_lima.AAC.1